MENNRVEMDDETVKEWIDGQKVIASVWSEKEGNLRIVAKDGEDYCLYRFFKLSGKAQCSVDIRKQPVEEFIETMLENLV